MAGSVEGGKKTAMTNKLRHGSDWYARIGRLGGMNGHTGGFACKEKGKDGLTGKERASKVGKIGGHISKRGPAK